MEAYSFGILKIKVHSQKSSTQEAAIFLYQNEDGLIFTHDLSKEQTTIILETSFYEINLSSLESYFFITDIDKRPSQLLHIYNDSTPMNYNNSIPVDYNLPFPENISLEDGKSYEINIKVPVDETILIQPLTLFNWAKVVVTVKEL